MTIQALDAAVEALNRLCGPPPDTAIVLGSGLGAVQQLAGKARRWPYPELGLPSVDVPGHDGELVLGEHKGSRVAFLSGRVHSYEGRSQEEVVRAVRAMARWGVKRVVLTSAVGSVVPDLDAGDLVLLEDHINFIGVNPLKGPRLDSLGPRFPDLTTAYSPTLRAQAQEAAMSRGVAVKQGIYAGMPGPSYETPAEVRMLAMLGATVVGMSMVPEVIALAHMGTPCMGVAMVANPGAGLSAEPLRHEDVTAAMAKAAVNLAEVVSALLERWA